jgi:hypothetical protein
VELRGTPTATDLVAAQWLHIKPRPAYAIVGIALLVCATWGIWYSFSVPSLRGNGWLLVGSVGLIAVLAVWTRYKAIRTYGQIRALQRAIRLEPTEAGLLSESETGRGTTPWSDFLKWTEGNGLFLLYISDDMFHIVPKRFFSSKEDIAEFRNMLATRVSPR